jgi:hypothetical protein
MAVREAPEVDDQLRIVRMSAHHEVAELFRYGREHEAAAILSASPCDIG